MKLTILKILGLIILINVSVNDTFSQTDLDKQNESDTKFLESDIFKSQFAYTVNFFNLIMGNNLENFLIKGNFDKNWKERNEKFIDEYDSIQYYMINCNIKDTSVYFTFNYDSKKNERIRETDILLKFSCPDKVEPYLNYNAKMTFYNKEDGELIFVEPSFKKFILNPSKMPAFPSVNKSK